MPAFSSGIQKLPRIEDAVWIERVLKRAVGGEGGFAEGLADPAFFGEADAVLAGDGAAVVENPVEEEVERGVRLVADFRDLIVADHEIGVDVAVAGVAEAGDGDAGVLLQLAGEGDEFDELGARDDDVLVEFGETG